MEKKFTFLYSGPLPSESMFLVYTEETAQNMLLPQLYAVSDLKKLPNNGNIPGELLVISTEEVIRFESEHINPNGDSFVQSTSKSAKDLSTREKNSLLTIIAALCNYSDIDIGKRGTAIQLSELTREIGSSLDDETIRKYLKLIPDALK